MPELRSLPKVDVLAASEALATYPPKVAAEAARRAIQAMRASLVAGESPGEPEALAVEAAIELTRPSFRRVINASGVVLHTGLGRARLASAAVEAIRVAAEHHVDVELDLETGKRGDRQDHVSGLLCELTGAEAALVVNNCAAAVFLTLAAIGKGGEVVLSRGQMVEIGGSFRMPDIVRRSGCRLVEVGCTNKTRLSDFEEAIGPRTRAILRCHPSNFHVVGFVEEPSIGDLATLAHAHRLPLIDDVGSGCLVDTTRFGLPREPLFGESLRHGADLALASGDKLLGGPQAGLIVGGKEWLAKIAHHPIARAVRVDKLTLAALEATLRLYRNGQEDQIPTLRYLGRSPETVKAMATSLASALPGSRVEPGVTEVGGGSAPGTGVPTWRCGLPLRHANRTAQLLRSGDPSIVTRIEAGVVWLDPRTMEDDEVGMTVALLRSLG